MRFLFNAEMLELVRGEEYQIGCVSAGRKKRVKVVQVFAIETYC